MLQNLITEWWGGLDFSLQLFYAIGIFALLLLAVQVLMLVITGGDDGDADFDPQTSGSYFSFKGITALAMGFAWTGVICVKAGLHPAMAAGLGVFVGVGVEAGFLLMMKQISKLQSDGTFKLESAVGSFGTVYATVPPNGEGAGEVVVKTPSRSVHVRAFSNSDVALRSGDEVEVVGMHGGAILVKKVSWEEKAPGSPPQRAPEND